MRKYNPNIDFIKTLAIISVILLHCLNAEQRNAIGGVYTILHAVPLFIMISGFNTVRAIRYDRLTEFFRLQAKDYVIKRINRIVLPFLFIFVIEMLYVLLNRIEVASVINLVKLLIKGGTGPGGYYIVLMLQLFLVTPILSIFTKRYKEKAVLAVLIINIVFEILVVWSGLNNEWYRLLLMRFLLALELGVYHAIYPVKLNWKLYIGAAASALYITAVEYFQFPSFAQENWRSQNVYAYFYPFLLFVIAMSVPLSKKEWFLNSIKSIGQASFHIFLIQLLYFVMVAPTVQSLIPSLVLYSMMSVISCVIVGIAFYKIEQFARGN